ncbi:MAG: PAS domain-containing sensor histidine kinase [Alphaproteobacteria bacterium]|nr:PAS domain-containing sensor histidine kinase [Alphaproteobacteria bacterium]MCY4609845.1 ATP-binding protein [bacterium]
MGLIVPLVLVEAGIFLVLVATGELAVAAAAAGFAVLAVMSVVLVWPLVSGVDSIRSWIVRRSGLPDLEPPGLRRGPLAPQLQSVLHAVSHALDERDTRIVGLARDNDHLLDALTAPVLLVSNESELVRFNGAADRVFGDLRAGQHVSRILRDPGFDGAIAAGLGDGLSSVVEVVVTRDHVDSHLVLDVAPLPAGMGDAALMVVCHDVTGARRTEQMRVDFVANASHEIRSPLTTLIGCIETLQGPARDDADSRARFLAMMEAQGRRMANLVEDLLSLSRIEIREHSQPNGEVTIAPLLCRLASTLHFEADRRSMTIDLDIPESMPAVRGDEDEIEQALYNLIANAIGYGRQGTVVSLAAGVADRPPDHLRVARGRLAWISVTDRGDGIEAHHLPRLTERFYRVDKARSRERGGTGLGLAIVKHILSRHRGELHVASTPGKGSVFTVWLPAVFHENVMKSP